MEPKGTDRGRVGVMGRGGERNYTGSGEGPGSQEKGGEMEGGRERGREREEMEGRRVDKNHRSR